MKVTADSVEKENSHRLLADCKVRNICYGENKLVNVINYSCTIKLQMHLCSHGKCKMVYFTQDYILILYIVNLLAYRFILCFSNYRTVLNSKIFETYFKISVARVFDVLETCEDENLI